MDRAMKPENVERLADASAAREEILEAYLFGSHARGKARPDSDINAAVYIDEATADDGNRGYRAELTTDLMVALETNDVDMEIPGMTRAMQWGLYR